LIQRRLQILDDLGRVHLGRGQVVDEPGFAGEPVLGAVLLQPAFVGIANGDFVFSSAIFRISRKVSCSTSSPYERPSSRRTL